MLKVKGLKFLETWFGTPECVPPNLTKLYQLLLYMVTVKGTIPANLALRIGDTARLIGEAITRGYVELSFSPKKPSEDVLKQIRKIIEKPSREIVV